ncbi:hypothetical protein VTK56DRAFT_2594 [Thermocarpiscus australiensis]
MSNSISTRQLEEPLLPRPSAISASEQAFPTLRRDEFPFSYFQAHLQHLYFAASPSHTVHGLRCNCSDPFLLFPAFIFGAAGCVIRPLDSTSNGLATLGCDDPGGEDDVVTSAAALRGKHAQYSLGQAPWVFNTDPGRNCYLLFMHVLTSSFAVPVSASFLCFPFHFCIVQPKQRAVIVALLLDCKPKTFYNHHSYASGACRQSHLFSLISCVGAMARLGLNRRQ